MEATEKTLTIITKTDLEEANKIDAAVVELLGSGLKGFAMSIAKAKVVEMIHAALTDAVLAPVLKLENKKYGFRTDQKEGYKPEIIKDCLIEATLKGLEPTGNQFNIIAGNCYATKEGCTAILSKMGCYNEVSFLLSKEKDGVTVIPTTIDWNFKGKTGKKTIEFPVKVYKGVTTEEAIRGKAERKIKAWLIEYLTGMQVGDGDVDRTVDGTYEVVVEAQDEKSTLKDLKDSLNETLQQIVEDEKVVISEEDKKKQSDGDTYLLRAKNKIDLEKRKDYCVTSFPSFNLDKYNELLKTLPE